MSSSSPPPCGIMDLTEDCLLRIFESVRMSTFQSFEPPASYATREAFVVFLNPLHASRFGVILHDFPLALACTKFLHLYRTRFIQSLRQDRFFSFHGDDREVFDHKQTVDDYVHFSRCLARFPALKKVSIRGGNSPLSCYTVNRDTGEGGRVDKSDGCESHAGVEILKMNDRRPPGLASIIRTDEVKAMPILFPKLRAFDYDFSRGNPFTYLKETVLMWADTLKELRISQGAPGTCTGRGMVDRCASLADYDALRDMAVLEELLIDCEVVDLSLLRNLPRSLRLLHIEGSWIGEGKEALVLQNAPPDLRSVLIDTFGFRDDVGVCRAALDLPESVQELTFRSHAFKDAGPLVPFRAAHPHIRDFTTSGRLVSWDSLTESCSNLSKLAVLELELSPARLDDALVLSLLVRMKQLRDLKLNDAYIGVDTIVQVLTTFRALENVYISSGLNRRSVHSLCDKLKALPTGNDIGARETCLRSLVLMYCVYAGDSESDSESDAEECSESESSEDDISDEGGSDAASVESARPPRLVSGEEINVSLSLKLRDALSTYLGPECARMNRKMISVSVAKSW